MGAATNVWVAGVGEAAPKQRACELGMVERVRLLVGLEGEIARELES